jgi:hypothetical protein
MGTLVWEKWLQKWACELLKPHAINYRKEKFRTFFGHIQERTYLHAA